MDTTFSDKGEFAFVRVSYTPFSGFDPNDYAINGRISATQCKNPVNELFVNADVTSADSDVYYPLVHIEKSDTQYEMVIVLPEKIYSADCLYNFKVNNICEQQLSRDIMSCEQFGAKFFCHNRQVRLLPVADCQLKMALLKAGQVSNFESVRIKQNFFF